MDTPVPLPLDLELPRGEHRARLLDALGHLIRRRGFEPFVSAPVLLPRSEYFPERWEPTIAGARRLLRRLMHYAGLGEFEVSLETWRERPAVGGELTVTHTGNHAAAWFAGFRDDTCEFGLELEQLRHEEALVATLGHEVAHAFRDRHGLVIRDRDLEEKLTDLTSVYLGFGMFALNASLGVKTGGFSSSGEKLLYERHSLGYLAPNEFALLLGAQLSVRADEGEQRAVCKALSPNHAALVASALREFAEESVALREQLSVPEPSAWPPRSEVGRLPALPDDDEELEPPDDADGEPADGEPADDGDPTDDAQPAAEHEELVFRVKRTRAVGVGALALGGSAAAGVAIGAGTSIFYGLCALGTAAGVTVGRRLRADECSGCRARLALADERCPGCGGRLAGEIANHDERLEAEERYRAGRGQAEAVDEDGQGDPERDR